MVIADEQFTMFGYDQGVLSSLLTLPSFRETFPSTATGFGYAQSLLVAVCESDSTLNTMLTLQINWDVCLVRCLICTPVINLAESRRSMCKLPLEASLTFSAGIGIIIGTILQAASVNYGMMIFARIFNGIFNGMLTSTVPTYQSECSRPERRGPDVMISATVNIFVSHFNWCIAEDKGLMCSYWVGLAFYYSKLVLTSLFDHLS